MKNMKNTTTVLLGIAAQFLIMPTLSFSAEDDENKTANLGMITVTANKMEENIQDVPQSITVIDGIELQEKGITDIKNLVKEIPNFTFISDTGNGTQMNVRGLNYSQFTNNNPIVIYVDGIPQSSAFGFNMSMVNIERVEILRGPQGTMYGKDAIGGVINIITREPTDTWSGEIGSEYGSNDFMLGTFNASGPLIKERLWSGISVQAKQDDGWITNTFPGMEEDANQSKDNTINGFLLYKPNNRLTSKFTLTRDYSKGEWIDGYGLPGFGIEHFDRDSAENVSFDVPSSIKTENNSQGLSINYDFNTMSLTSVTTHKNSQVDYTQDLDYTSSAAMAGAVMFNDIDTDTWTQEIRLSSIKTEGIRWVTGLYFDIENSDRGPYGYDFPAFGASYLINAESESDSTTMAVFGQVIIPLLTRFEMTLGGRYQRIEKEIDLVTSQSLSGFPISAPYELSDDTTWDTFLPKAALSYKVNDNWTTYVSVAKGYMPGGYNYFAMAGTAEDNSFDPQTSINYEVGVKGAFDSLYLGASIFYMDIEDIHVYKSVGSMWMTDNAEKAHALGAELEFRYFVTKTLTIDGAIGIIDTEYDDYDSGTRNYDGEDLERTPSHTIRLGVGYNHPIGLYSRFDVRNQGSMFFFDDANAIMAKEDGYTVADVKLGFRFSDWDVYAYVKNIADEEYIDTFKSMSSPDVSIATFGDPRTVGIGVRYYF